MLALLPLALSLLPDLARYVAGDTAGAVATRAAEAVREVVGTDDPAAAAAALADPAKAADLRLRLADLANERQRDEDEAKQRRLEALLADVAGARARDLAMRQGGQRNVRADVMVALVLVGLATVLLVLWRAGFSPGSAVEGFLIACGGVFLGCFKDAFGFEFGSSRGSADKTEIMARQAERAGTPAAVATTGNVTVNPLGPSPSGVTADDLNAGSLERARGTVAGVRG